MNAPTNVLRIPSSRVRRHGSSPLALLATVSLALVLGVMAVVLLQGDPAQAQQLGSTSQRAARIVRLTFDDGPVRANTPRVLNVLSNYRVKATFFVIGQRARRHPRFGQKRIPRGTLCTEPHLHPSRLDHPWQCWDQTRASRHKPGYHSSRRTEAVSLSPS